MRSVVFLINNQEGMKIMETILSKSTERQRRLLIYISRNYHWITAQELAEYLDCNIKTVRQDIAFLEENYSDILTVEYSKQFGYRFHTVDGRNLLEIYLEWIKESLFFSILSDCFAEKNTSLDYFYDTYFISETTLKRQLTLINRTLKNIGVSISVSTGKLKVKDERLLRYFYALFSLEKRSIYEWTDIDMDQEKLFRLIALCENYFDMSLSIVQKNIFSYFVYISITRSSQNNLWSEEIDVPNDFHELLQTELLSVKSVETLDAFLTEDAQYRDSVKYIYFIFDALSTEYRSTKVSEMTHQLISLISSKMKVEIDVIDFDGLKKEMAYVSFMNQTYASPVKLVSLRSELNAKSIKSQYAIFYDVALQSIKELEKSYPWLEFYENLLISRAFRYWDYKEFESISKIKSVSVYVSTTLEKNHADILSHLLKKIFQTKIEIIGSEYGKTVFNSRIPNALFEEADLVVTNHLFYQGNDKVLIVDDVIENARLESIKQSIDEILFENMSQGIEE